MQHIPSSVADPGFPVGGRRPVGGGTNLQRVHFLAKTYAKTKEMDPVGGGGACAGSAPLDPPMVITLPIQDILILLMFSV